MSFGTSPESHQFTLLRKSRCRAGRIASECPSLGTWAKGPLVKGYVTLLRPRLSPLAVSRSRIVLPLPYPKEISAVHLPSPSTAPLKRAIGMSLLRGYRSGPRFVVASGGDDSFSFLNRDYLAGVYIG